MTYLKQLRRTSKPRLVLPHGACDSHAHIFGQPETYPFAAERGYTPPPALVPEYLAMLETIGVERAVIVQPSVYGFDNACTLDAVAEIGLDRARAVVAVRPSTTLDQLAGLRARGARGVRFMTVGNDQAFIDSLEGLSRRLADLCMHVQLYVRPGIWRVLLPVFERADVDVVLDHVAFLHADRQSEADNIQVLRTALDRGRLWVKLSQYRGSLAGHPYTDMNELVTEILLHAPERCVWGTDWPHPHLSSHMPDDGELVDLMSTWATDDAARHRMLVDNPARLYGFDRVG